MALMIALSVGLKLYQEAKADSVAAKLKAMISVRRRCCETASLARFRWRSWSQATSSSSPPAT